MNDVTLLGNLTAEPRLMRSVKGSPYVYFTVAVTRRMLEQDGTRKADFINCVAFSKTAENISKYFHKGNQILVQGAWRTDSYEKEGVTYYSNKLAVSTFYFTRGSSNGGNYQGQPQTQEQAPMGIPIEQADQMRQDFAVPQVDLNPTEDFSFSSDDDFGF